MPGRRRGRVVSHEVHPILSLLSTADENDFDNPSPLKLEDEESTPGRAGSTPISIPKITIDANLGVGSPNSPVGSPLGRRRRRSMTFISNGPPPKITPDGLEDILSGSGLDLPKPPPLLFLDSVDDEDECSVEGTPTKGRPPRSPQSTLPPPTPTPAMRAKDAAGRLQEKIGRSRSATGAELPKNMWGSSLSYNEMVNKTIDEFRKEGPTKWDDEMREMTQQDFEEIANHILAMDSESLEHLRRCDDEQCPDGCVPLKAPVIRKALLLYETFHQKERKERLGIELRRMREDDHVDKMDEWRGSPRAVRRRSAGDEPRRRVIGEGDFGVKCLVDDFLVCFLHARTARPRPTTF